MESKMKKKASKDKEADEKRKARKTAKEADTRASRMQARIRKQKARDASRLKKKAEGCYAGLRLSQRVSDWRQQPFWSQFLVWFRRGRYIGSIDCSPRGRSIHGVALV